MTEYEIPIIADTVLGEKRVGFRGMNALSILDGDGSEIVETARDKYNLDSIENRTVIGTVVASDDPKHHVTNVEWHDVE